jgi:hypothetical protein
MGRKFENNKLRMAKTALAYAKKASYIGKKVVIAVKSGGGDPTINRQLAAVMAEANALNVPKDVIKNNVKRALDKDTSSYEELTYEVYGHGGVGHGVAVHVDGKDGSALICRQAHQCLAHHDRRLDVCRSVGHRAVVLDQFCGGRTVAAQTIQAGVHDNPVQPAPDCRVATERTGGAVRGEQCLLQGVVGILGGLGTPPRKPT